MPEISRFFAMYYSLVSAEYVEAYRLRVVFEDGTTAVVDLSPYTKRGGVFRKLSDLTFFKSFKINPDFGVICWGSRCEVDIAPESLYELAGGSGKVARVAEAKPAYGKLSGITDSPASPSRRRGP